MKIVFGADHKSIAHRDELMTALREIGEVTDVVKLEPSLADYVEVAEKVAERVRQGGDCGVIVCGTGIGISIVANKHAGISAARCVSVQDAVDSKLINNANVLCLSAATPVESNREIIKAFFATEFPGDERRVKRLEKIAGIEQRNFR